MGPSCHIGPLRIHWPRPPLLPRQSFDPAMGYFLDHLTDPGVAVMVHLYPEMAEGLQIGLELVNYGDAYAKVDGRVSIAGQYVPECLPDVRVPFRVLHPRRLVYHPPGPWKQDPGVQGLEERDRGDGEVGGPVAEGLGERGIELLNQLRQEPRR